MKIRGHETFSIRKGWLHKGVKNILAENRLFTDKENVNPCDKLGIGANMVKSLRYWLTAANIMEEANQGNLRIQRITDFGLIIDEYDKFYEEEGTLFLIHYQLAKNKNNATAWYWFFNEFKANRFDKDLFVNEFYDYLKTEENYNGSTKTIEDEFDCLIKTYCPKEKNDMPEDTLECPLSDLKLIEFVDTRKREYRKSIPYKDSLHPLIAYAVLSDSKKSDEILISDIISDNNSIYKIFNLDRSTLFYILDKLQKRDLISVSRTAGLDLIKINQNHTFIQCVEMYYHELNRDGVRL